MKQTRTLNKWFMTLYLGTGMTGWTFAASKPNIVYILADDMGYGDVKALNPECKFPTPNLDQMAKEGMTFTDAHTNSSCCSPTRYGIMTGRYAWRSRLKKGVLSGYSPLLIDKNRTTLASYLKKEGYATACIGKWHIGIDWPMENKEQKVSSTNVDYGSDITGGPTDVGFDYYYGLAGSLGMAPHGFIENRRLQGELGTVLKEKKGGDPAFANCRPGQTTKGFDVRVVLRQITERGVAYIEQSAQEEKSFFLYFSLNSPHAPVAPHADWVGKSGINAYGDFCMETDWSVGQIMQALKKSGIEKNTLVIFAADNGCSQTAGFKALTAAGHRPGYIYRGIKSTLYEGGHRVAHLVKWPETIKPGSTCDQTICTTDFLATLADIAGKPLSDNEGEDSVSFLPALKGQAIDPTHREAVIHHSSEGHFAIRRGKWKLILHPNNGLSSERSSGDMPPVINPADIQLFDIEEDPSEKTNVQAQHPETVAELSKLLAQYITQGRSNAGAPQKNDPGKKKWAQIDWMKNL